MVRVFFQQVKRFYFFALFLLFIPQINDAHATPLDPRQIVKVGGMNARFQILGIPEDYYRTLLVPGLRQRAQAIQMLTHILYHPEEREKLFQRFPNWRTLILENPGYFPELVGRVPESFYMRIYGPDVWILEDGRPYVGEENGGNAGGPEFLYMLTEKMKQIPDFGDVPYEPNAFPRWFSMISPLADRYFKNKRPKLMVFADEVSASDKSILLPSGKRVTPPAGFGPEYLEMMRAHMKSLGVEFVSLVDNRGDLKVMNDQLFLKRADNTWQRVDVLFYFANIESADPAYEPQVQRNIRHEKHEYNEQAELIGIPNLIKAWKKGSFLMVGNPTSLWTRWKIAPLLVDQFITAETGAAPLLPVHKTHLFRNTDGTTDLDQLHHVEHLFKDLAIKDTQMGGGKGTFLGPRIRGAAKRRFLTRFKKKLAEDPTRFIAQPFVKLQNLGGWNVDGDSSYASDLRPPMFLVGHNAMNSEVSMAVNWMNRYGKGKVGLSGGGHMIMAVPYPGKKFKILDPIPHVGARQVAISHPLSPEDQGLLLRNGQNIAITAARFIREYYRNPEAFDAEMPGLRRVMEESFFYRPEEVERQRRSPFPSVLMIGPDILDLGPDHRPRYKVIEWNPTNVGGLIRLLQAGVPGVREELHKLFQKLISIYKDHRPEDREVSMVYMIEDSQLGRPGSAKYDPRFQHELENFRKWFFEEFGVILISRNQVTGLKVEDDQLTYTEQGKKRIVDIFFSNFEPDFIDPIPSRPLSMILSGETLEDASHYQIPGFNRVVDEGNVFVIASRGHDIVATKRLTEFFPRLHKKFLGIDELIPTAPTFPFVSDEGEVHSELIREVMVGRGNFFIKDGASNGGGGGAIDLRRLNRAARTELTHRILNEPHRFDMQPRLVPFTNEFGIRPELRTIHVVSYYMNGNEDPRVLAEFPIYVRGAPANQSTVNLVPTGGQQPGFFMPTRVDPACAKALKIWARIPKGRTP